MIDNRSDYYTPLLRHEGVSTAHDAHEVAPTAGESLVISVVRGSHVQVFRSLTDVVHDLGQVLAGRYRMQHDAVRRAVLRQ